MLRRRWILPLAVLLLAAAGVRFSGADFVASSSNPAVAVGTYADWAAPSASASVIGRSGASAVGTIKQGGTYYVYATVSDSGNPATGTASVKADVSSITSGQAAAVLSAGTYPAGGTTYNYRSGPLTANATLAAGSYAYTLTLADAGANSATQSGFSVTLDNTSPTASDVQSANVSGGTAGKPDLGDQLTLTYSEAIEPTSILASWTGATTSVVVRITDGGTGNDTLTIRNAANATQLPLGSVGLGRKDYVTATRDFGATGSASQMTLSGGAVTLVLGTPSGTTTTAAATGSLVWTPSATATDVAGNAASTTAKTETGTADLDF